MPRSFVNLAVWAGVIMPTLLIAQVEEYQGQTASGAYYRLAVPTQWQPGDGLVIWNHGYQGYSSAGPDPSPSLGPLADEILAEGFALAASSYSQIGWAVFASHIDNQQLYQRFVELVGTPEHVLIQGASLGGIVTLRDLEAGLIPRVTGALLMCGASAGARNWYNAIDLRIIYEAVCEEVDNAELPTDSWYEIPDLLTGELQFLRSLVRCTGLISLSLFDQPFVSLLQSNDQRQRLQTILTLADLEFDFLPLVLGYAVFELPRLVNDTDKLAGARPFSSAGIDYGVPEINQSAKRLAGLPSARRALLENYTPTGTIGAARLVSIHTSRDGLVSVDNQGFLEQLVPPDRITAAVVAEEQPSHCGFNTAEGLAAWESLLDWTDGGAQPDADDIQNRCLSLTETADDCRFDPDLVVHDDPVRFPREARLASASSAIFDENTGRLAVQGIQIAGDSSAFHLELQPVSSDKLRFAITEVTASEDPGGWSHRARYFPDSAMLYLPDLQAAPPRPGSNRFDVYLQYDAAGGQEWLELLEYEETP